MVPKSEAAAVQKVQVLQRSEITGVLVRLEVGGCKYLFIRLDADGGIQRLGTTDRDILRGNADPDLFERLVVKVTPQLLRWVGQSWSDPNPLGKVCLLVVGFRQTDGREAVMRWEYGSDSHEPPAEVLDFVMSTVEVTNPWFGEQKVFERNRRRRSAPQGWRLVPQMEGEGR